MEFDPNKIMEKRLFQHLRWPSGGQADLFSKSFRLQVPHPPLQVGVLAPLLLSFCTMEGAQSDDSSAAEYVPGKRKDLLCCLRESSSL